MTIIKLHEAKKTDDVVNGLRGLADDIEAGEIDWPVTTAVVVLGHTDGEVPTGDGHKQAVYWRTYGYGPRSDTFTLRGLMASSLKDWEG